MSFDIKDSGTREHYDSGMVRDTEANKDDWHRVADGPMLRRWMTLLTNAARGKYHDNEDGSPNWTRASGDREHRRFRRSAFRHFMQWYFGMRDEDHAAAVFFNINGAEYVEERRDLGKQVFDPDSQGPVTGASDTDPYAGDPLVVRRQAAALRGHPSGSSTQGPGSVPPSKGR